MNRKLTGALAWGGLALILAVPSADLISAQLDSAPAPAEPAVDSAITTASVDGVRTVVPVIKTLPVPVNGKPMPDYISDPDDEAVTVPDAGPAPQVPAPEPEVETALVAPQPMPAHMRPLPPAVPTTPLVVAPPVTDTAAVQPSGQPLVLDEDRVLANEAAVNPPPARNVPRPPAMVGEDELQDWDSGSLADYLERRGLMSDASYSETTVGETVDEEYDADGFFLSDGPNQPRRRSRDFDDDSFIVFPFD